MPKGKVLSTPEAAAKKWGTNLAGATQAITEGVKNVQSSPGADAAAAKAAWVAAMTSADVQNRWAANVAKVSVADWQAKMIAKGIPAIANAIAAGGQDKFQKSMAKILPAIQNVLNGLPTGRATFNQRLQRVNAYLTGMHNYNGKLGASD